MRKRGVGAVLALLATASGVSPRAQTVSGSIRPEGPAVRALIDGGVERSATFRELLDELDNGDVVVYVRFAPCAGGVPACLLWASGDSTTRRLLIKVDRFSGPEDGLTALLAHELQHAFEVASAPDIKDVRSFTRWFEAHGWRGSHGFETNEAAAVTKTVTAELRDSAVAARTRH